MQAGGAGVQGAECAFHGRIGELAGMMQALAEADDAAEAVEHAKPVAGGGADEQAAVVGAQVECREHRGSAIGAVRRLCGVGELVHRLAPIASMSVAAATMSARESQAPTSWNDTASGGIP